MPKRKRQAAARQPPLKPKKPKIVTKAWTDFLEKQYLPLMNDLTSDRKQLTEAQRRAAWMNDYYKRGYTGGVTCKVCPGVVGEDWCDCAYNRRFAFHVAALHLSSLPLGQVCDILKV